MVSSTDKARARFIDWLNDRLDRANVVRGRGRGAALAKRYKVTPQFANDWLGGRKMPSSLKLLEIVADLEGTEPSSELEAYQLIARQQFKIKDGDEIRVAAREISPGYVRLPLLQMEAGMGFDAYSDEPSEVVEYLDVAEWWAQANLPKPTSRVSKDAQELCKIRP